jgi:hypothetical protein
MGNLKNNEEYKEYCASLNEKLKHLFDVVLDELDDFRKWKGQGCRDNIGSAIKLGSVLEWGNAELDYKVEIIKTLVHEFLPKEDAGFFLASINLIPEYENNPMLDTAEKRRVQYKNDYYPNKANGSSSSLRNMDDRSILRLAKCIINAWRSGTLKPILDDYAKKNQQEEPSIKISDVSATQEPIGVQPRQGVSQHITIPHEDGSYTGEYIINEKTGQPMPHGHGKLAWNNGSFYMGEFVQNERCGRGVLTKSNGDTVEANWKANTMDGSVKVKNDTGVYTGYVKSGCLTINEIDFNTGYRFEGNLTEDAIDGRLVSPDGRYGRFVSNAVLGLKVLSGDDDIKREIIKFPHLVSKVSYQDNGRVYEGEMSDDNVPHGYGRFIFSNNMALEVKTDMGVVRDKRGVWVFPHPSFFGVESLECVWVDNEWRGAFCVEQMAVEFTLTPDGDVSSIKILFEDGSCNEIIEYTPEDNFIWVKSSNGKEYKGDFDEFTKLVGDEPL